MAKTYWKALKKGDIVDIVAPGSGAKPEALEKAAAYIRSLGLIPRIPADMVLSGAFYSNTDAYRFAHLKKALLASDSKMVWCIKGGYGTTRIVPKLIGIKPQKTKLVLGFSDNTSLHSVLNRHWGWATVHGPVLWQIAQGDIAKETLAHIEALIFGREKKAQFTLEPMNDAARKKRKISAEVTGGNMAIVEAGIGTKWEIKGRGKILMLEEVNESPYRADRMLEHLRQAGTFKGVKAIILGDYMGEEADAERMAERLSAFAEKMKVPVLRSREIGHGAINHPLPFNTAATLSLGENALLKVESGAR